MRDSTFDDIALKFAEFMTYMFREYPKHEVTIANIMADSLGGLIAIAAKDPAATMEHIVQRLKSYPWQQVRADHMMVTQGIKDSSGQLRTPHIGLVPNKPG